MSLRRHRNGYVSEPELCRPLWPVRAERSHRERIPIRVTEYRRRYELDSAIGESFDGVARGARGVAGADVVEHDHVVAGGEVVQELRVPPVERASDPVQQDQRDATPRAEAPVGERRGGAFPR